MFLEQFYLLIIQEYFKKNELLMNTKYKTLEGS